MADRDQDLRKRFLRDIAELQTRPYPNINLHIQDDDLTTACLVLTPEGWIPLHLTIHFGDLSDRRARYPLKPPTVKMDSKIDHPNVFDTYICASILNTTEGYTPAYTLKAIAIQLLSFFGSDSIQQSYGETINLDTYRQFTNKLGITYKCDKCQFGHNPLVPTLARTSARSRSGILRGSLTETSHKPISPARFFIGRLPNEILLEITNHLEFEDLTTLTRSWDRMSRLVTDFNVIRNRELQCFVFKQSYLEQNLGVGVHVSGNGRYRRLDSEFDLISQKAYKNHGIRRSVQGLTFERWLPLPISHGHWRRVQKDASASLLALSKDAGYENIVAVIYGFMNDVVARLNSDIERQSLDANSGKSSLRHASEKAIESYFHLFHLLLCLATSPGGQWIVDDANRMIQTFMSGKTSKDDIPNLGNLLTALLISDTEPTEPLMRAIVKEAITRNVVWLLDQKGAGMAELAYLETDKISHYRLRKTFQGSRVSYRILMFSELFRRTARPTLPRPATATTTPQPTPPPNPSPNPIPSSLNPSYSSIAATSPPTPIPNSSPPTRPTLPQILTTLFTYHGAPPPGTAALLASQVRRIQSIDEFPSFLKEMGVSNPGKAVFTAVLRETMRDSAEMGYHVWRPGMDVVGGLRIIKDKEVDVDKVVAEIRRRGARVMGPERIEEVRRRGGLGFFPGRERGRG